MSREIKFRAWDIESKKIIYKVSVFESCAFKNNKHLPVKNGDRNYIIEQFTGLTDKNSFEIYEGDIVKLSFTEHYSNECVTVDEDTVITGKIIFENGGYFINEKDSTWFYLYDMTDCADIEVIGNIHENPELL